MKIFLKQRTETEWDEYFQKYLMFESSIKNSYYLLRILIWKSVIKGITVAELFVLDQLIVKQWNDLDILEKRLYLLIVSLSGASRKRATNFETRLRAIRKSLSKYHWTINVDPNRRPVTESFDQLKLPGKGLKLDITVSPIWIPSLKSAAYTGWARSMKDGQGKTTPPHVVKEPLGFKPTSLDYEGFIRKMTEDLNLFFFVRKE